MVPSGIGNKIATTGIGRSNAANSETYKTPLPLVKTSSAALADLPTLWPFALS
ncbi:MAG: hypothetical protein Ct9H300mP4_03820 [Gammaproteobacteria bacterium]|nr:MAG: hypothetical protein Ct9H300mP4_03820 [Gammaproteobacteria bacterium]